MSIGPDDLRRKARELLGQSGDAPGMEPLAELFKYIGENYGRLTPEAKVLAGRGWEAMKPELQAILAALPDVPEARQLKRLYARLEGDHWDAAGLMGGLEAPPSRKHPIIDAAKPLFTKHLQAYLDLLWDAAQHTHQGARMIQMLLFAFSADELLSAFHLAQRGYASQALSHVRTVFEALDLIELFKRSPELVDDWAALDPRRAWDEFRPGAVRRKLGEESNDPIYSFLSEHGPHVTWRMIRNRAAVRVKESGTDERTMMLWVGGTPLVHTIVFSIESCLQALVACVIKVAAVFGYLLHKGEALAAIRAVSEEYSQFILDYFAAWAREVGLDPTELERFIHEEIPSRLDQAMHGVEGEANP